MAFPPGPYLECSGVTKKFGGSTALDAVDLIVTKGTVHAIVGENGAGKSTLGKVIAGVLTADAGLVKLNGEPVAFKSPLNALQRGITMVAQELSLVPARTVADNVFLGMESTRGPFLDATAQRERFDQLVAQTGIDLPRDAVVSQLSIADQQKVEILRALARNAELIVMDEPTARLTSEEATVLRRAVRQLCDQGVTIIYVSHFLDEVLAIADQITILRDGRVVRSSPTTDENPQSLIEGIVGRSLDGAFPERRAPKANTRPVLEIQDLSRGAAFANVSFEVRAGEIVTLAGLVGSGRSEVLRAIFGADRPTAGSMLLDGKPYSPRSPRAAIRNRVAMIPESRRSDGLFPLRTVRENVTLAHLGQFVSAFGTVQRAKEGPAAMEVTDNVGLSGATIASRMNQLSGGNQQKSLFARWLISKPRLLLADEPTRGVDVGAKRGIYDLIAGLAEEGMAVVVVSSELEEVLGIAHRILVMRNGCIAGELSGATATESDVMQLAFGLAVA